MTLTIDQALMEAVQAHQSGQLQKAEQLYCAILQVQPEHADANHNLGVLNICVGKPAKALPYLRAALAQNQAQKPFWVSYVTALMALDQFNDALAAVARATELGIPAQAFDGLIDKIPSQAGSAQSKPKAAKRKDRKTRSGLQAGVKQLVKEPHAKDAPTPQELALLQRCCESGEVQAGLSQAIEFSRKYPNHVMGWEAQWTILHSSGKFSEALEPLLQMTRISPHDPDVYNKLGITQKALGRFSEAEASYRQAIRLKADFVLSLSNLSVLLHEQGRYVEAEANASEAVRLNPDFAAAHYNWGNALKSLGRLNDAENAYRNAIRLSPDFAMAYGNLGNVMKDLERLAEAQECYRKAIELKPDFASIHSNLGNILNRLDQFKAAEACYREALSIEPDFAEGLSNLGKTLQDLGRFSEAIDCHRRAISLKPDLVEAHSNLLFELNYVESVPSSSTIQDARAFGACVTAKAQPKFSSWKTDTGSQKLRVGFVSGDFNRHPVGYFVEGLIKHLDRTQFDVYAFPASIKEDDLTQRIKPYTVDWIPIHTCSDLEAAKLIHAAGIQVLIDLSGHTAHNRLAVFAYKPAPVQVSWLGYFATTGLPEMDYFLGDPIMAPQCEQPHFTEKLWPLAETWLCLTPPAEPIEISQLSALSNGHVTFGCFGNLSKINDQVMDAWLKILHRVPKAKLHLKSKQLADAEVMADVAQRFTKQGIAAERLILEGPDLPAVYFGAYNRIDMVLDTFPYPGGTTSVDALWMGVPVLTLRGNRFLSHLGESIATNAGLSNWIAENLDDYINKAVAFASDTQSLALLRQSLRARVMQSPLFDTPRFALNFGAALDGMWRECAAGKSEAAMNGIDTTSTKAIRMAKNYEQDQEVNFFHPVFWGTKEPEIFADLMRVAAKMTTAYHFSDNMFVFQRNNSMLRDGPFMDAWDSNIISESDKAIIWRRYIKAMAGFHCSHLEGDFVECGAYEGVGAKTVLDYLGGPQFPKTFWLYDMFEHHADMVNHAMPSHGPQLYDQVKERFAAYPNVKIFKGFLPDVLSDGSPEKIAYLHIDLNQAPAEIATLDALFDRVVPGGMIILDDYEMFFYRAQKTAEDSWFEKRGYKVFPLPTSQGFVIKR